MLESNQGHIGNDLDPRAGDDPGLYGWRASAESARFAKHLAAHHYGETPHHGYVYGGSGGARRSPLCLENAPDIYDGALPFMGGGPIAPGRAVEASEGVQRSAASSGGTECASTCRSRACQLHSKKHNKQQSNQQRDDM